MSTKVQSACNKMSSIYSFHFNKKHFVYIYMYVYLKEVFSSGVINTFLFKIHKVLHKNIRVSIYNDECNGMNVKERKKNSNQTQLLSLHS